MAKVLLLGASGLVGGELLRLLRLDARVTSIIAPTRNPLPAMNKLINPHGENIGQLLKMLHEPVDLVFCALGPPASRRAVRRHFVRWIIGWYC